jgi:L-amino acid N-acyltransferase YncA
MRPSSGRRRIGTTSIGRTGVTAGWSLGWVALTAYSARRVYSGVAWESVYVAADARGQGVGRALLEALIPASETAGFWTLLAGIMVENLASLGLHRRCGFRRVGEMRAMGQDGSGRWRDVVIMERRSERTGV